MQHHGRMVRTVFSAMVVLVLALIASVAAMGKSEPKSYPEEGKVIGTGTTAVPMPHGDTIMMPSYKIETATKIYQVRCSNSLACGGKNKLDIGEVIHFRERTKMRAQVLFFQAPGDDKERTVMVMSEELKPDATPAAQPPAQPDSKTPKQ
jgi:hypothetical protein